MPPPREGAFSTNVTPTPMPVRVAAAPRPAMPPPMMSALPAISSPLIRARVSRARLWVTDCPLKPGGLIPGGARLYRPPRDQNQRKTKLRIGVSQITIVRSLCLPRSTSTSGIFIHLLKCPARIFIPEKRLRLHWVCSSKVGFLLPGKSAPSLFARKHFLHTKRYITLGITEVVIVLIS